MHADALALKIKARWSEKFLNVNDVKMSDRLFLYTGHKTRTQSHVPAHVIFFASCSFLVVSVLVSVSHMRNACMWLKRCVPTQTCVFTLSAAWQYTFSDDSAIIEHLLTSHLHPNPPFDQTIHGTSADFIF